MSGVFFLATLSAIVVVIVWGIMNDKVGLFEETKGILAMRDDDYRSAAEDKGETTNKSRQKRGSRKSDDE